MKRLLIAFGLVLLINFSFTQGFASQTIDSDASEMIPRSENIGGKPHGYNCWDRSDNRLPTKLPDSAGLPQNSNDPGSISLDQIAPEFHCEINLSDNLYGNKKTDAIQFISVPTNGQAVIKLTLNPKTTEFSRAVFEIELGEKIEGHLVNISDSSTNNGFGGDSATQSRDSELQVVGDLLSVFADDHLKDANEKVLGKTPEFATPDSILTIEVSDNSASWRNSKGLEGKVSSPFIFSLNGQEDTEGEINYDIYASFNRVVSTCGRNGTGVKRVRIKLLH